MTITTDPIYSPGRTDPAGPYRYDRVAAVEPLPDTIGDSQAASYSRDGFIAFQNVLTADEVAQARAALSDLIHDKVPNYKGLEPEPEQKAIWPTLSPSERADKIRKLFRFSEYEPRLKSIGTEHPAIQRVLRRLLGETPHMIQDMALLKPPNGGREKPWHQDMAYFRWGPPEKIIGIWIALDPATAENGCMHVVPGTHREGPVPHHHLRDCQIADERVAVERDVIVPLEPGGVLFFSSLLHHGTPPNHSSNRRWALQYHYRAESAVPINRREHADLYFEGDFYAGCHAPSGTLLADITP
jgi:ectoine hydroxylase-related dioxygenase (phytanoyl-CoA dioxygenase family)